MKMRIAVPTDFSPLAKTGAFFAKAFAKQINADLVLMHVLPALGPTIGTTDSTHIRTEMLEEANKELHKLKDELSQDDVSITYQVVYGAAVDDVIEEFTKSYTIDLVVMASKGATGLKKIIIGSNTVGVINKCSKPIIVVPEQVQIGQIENLVYATDLKYMEREALLIAPYVKTLDASIEIIHVIDQHDADLPEIKTQLESLFQQVGITKLYIQLIKGDEVDATIEKHTDKNNGELLIMFTHHVHFLDQLFTKSITREVAWHCKTPLLVVNNR